MRLLIVSVVPLFRKLVVPPAEAAVPLAVNAPPVGAVVSDWAVKLAPAPVSPALLVAVTVPLPVGEPAVKV